jgi:hypothetical protein
MSANKDSGISRRGWSSQGEAATEEEDVVIDAAIGGDMAGSEARPQV